MSFFKVDFSTAQALPRTGRANGSKTTSATFKADFSPLPIVEADGDGVAVSAMPDRSPMAGDGGRRRAVVLRPAAELDALLKSTLTIR